MSETQNILLVGVGGQGTILVSKILTHGLIAAGYDVKMSEVHGMAQRGGSVSTQVRYGSRVFSPIIGPGEADILVAFEQMEALRWSDHLKPGGKLVVNDYQIPSAPILMGKSDYPQGVLEHLSSLADTLVVKGKETAEAVGNVKTMNVVLLGALVANLGLEDIDWKAALVANVKPATVEVNLKAFEAGKDLVMGVRA